MGHNEESKAVLVLEDGEIFYGRTSSPNGTSCGEIVFNTSMTGYQEICTDPSYANQIVLFTTAHIGNVGVNDDDYESSQPWVKGIIVREMSKTSSNWRSEKGFVEFLNENKVAWIEGLDTRKLTRHIRKNGTKNACMMVGAIDIDLALELAKNHVKAKELILSKKTTKQSSHSIDLVFLNDTFPPRNDVRNNVPKIFIYDFGVKSAILKMLALFGCEVHIVPNTMSAAELLAYHPDGVVISNGPGDPASVGEGIEEIRKIVFSGVPVLGICLGCQLIAIAAGGRTRKMIFGHHGANHPVYDLKKKKVYITSQNHHFVVDETIFPSEFEITHISLFDGSIQGIRAKNYPVMGFQGHPEGGPGPQDIEELFQEFLGKVILKNAVRSFN